MPQRFLEIGRVVGTHGIKGEVKIEVWADSPDFVKKLKNLYYNNGNENVNMTSCRVHKNVALITIDGVDNPSKADLLRGRVVYMDRQEIRLPKNRYFIADLIDLKVYDGNTNEYYGEVKEVFKTGANNVYKIVNGDKEYLFPAVEHMIKNTDIEKGIIEVLPIDGIFNDGGYSDAN